MKKIALSLAFVLALRAGSAPARAAGLPPGFPAAEASRLVQAADQGLAGLERAAADPKAGLSPFDGKYGLFRGSLTYFRSVMEEIKGALSAGDPELFGLLDRGSAALGELRVNWARTGGRNEAVAEGVRIASASYRLLRSTCGREGLRQRQGGALTEAERRQLQRVQRAERRFAESLQALRDRARQQGDAVTAAELERFRQEAERIAWAPADLETYLNSSIAAGELRGEWSADAPYVRKAAPPQEWAAADETVQDLYVDSDIGQVFSVNLGNLGDASAVSGQVQVFEPSQEVAAPEAVSPVAPVAPVAILPAVVEPANDGEETEAAAPEPADGVDVEEIVEPEEGTAEAAEETSVQPTVEATAPQTPQAATSGDSQAKATAAKPPAPPPPATPPNSPSIG